MANSSSSSSTSMKLLLFMVPLVIVMVLALFFHGPSVSTTLVLNGKHKFSSSSNNNNSSSSLFSNNNGGSEDVMLTKEEKNKTMAISDEYSPPTLHESLNKNEVDLNMSSKPWQVNESYYVPLPPLNESHVVPPKKEFSMLDRIEAGLIQARAAIKEARNWNQTQDPDYVPLGPMYWNAKAFHRSYLEMEKQFKVFIYEEGEPPVFHNGPCLSIYSSEGHFINAMEINEQFRTRDPQKAHVFFLPFSITMMVKFVYKSDFDFGPIKRTTIDYINLIASRYPFWNRSLGADHFMLSCHDWGPVISFAIPNLHKNSIRVLCNANTSERFNPTKDVSFPEINLLKGSIDDFIGGPSPSQRPILAFYAGRSHGPVRPILLDHWFKKDKDIQLYKTLPKGVSYYSMLRKSKFCLCPSGYEVASPRVVEAIYTGCVPVLISDHYVPPFSEVLNWKSFSIEVSLKDIPKLKEILMSVSPRKYIRMQRRVGQIRRHFEVHYPPRRYDVFHMILHSVWLRRLNIKIHDH